MTFNYQIGDGAAALDQQEYLDWLRGYQVVNAAGGSNLLTAGTGDFDVDAASGDINFGGTTISCSAQTVNLSGVVDPDNPRKVTVYRDLNGDLAYEAGVAEPAQDTGESRRDAYRPAPPPLENTDAVVLGTVWVAAGATSIVDADIRDRRLPAEANVETLTADTGTIDSLSGTDMQYESVNNTIQVMPGDDVQSKLDEAGSHGEVNFRPGTHEGQGYNPYSDQTIDVGHDVEFKPTSDATVWDFTGADEVNVQGELYVRDLDQKTTSADAVLIEDLTGANIDGIVVDDAYTGVAIRGGANSVNESHFGYIKVPNYRYIGFDLSGSVHDNTFGATWIEGGSTGIDGFRVDTSGTDGGNMFSLIGILHAPRDGLFVRSLDREFWVGVAVIDSSGRHGLNFASDSARAAFFNTLWTAGCSSVGARLAGSSTSNPLYNINIGQHYSVGNTNEGLRVEYTEDVSIGHGTYRANDIGVNLAGGESNGFWMGRLVTGADQYESANSTNGVSFADAGADCVVESAKVPDGINAVANLKRWDGNPMPEDLTSRTGGYDGERAYHNGTDGGNTNREEPATWTGSDWEGEISDSIIT